MAELFAWVTGHWAELLGILTGLLAVASTIVKLTPTDKDDLVLMKILQWVSVLQPKGVAGVKLPLTAPKK